MRNACIAKLYKLASDDPNIVVLVADNGAIVYDDFRREFPNQFINLGIAEANMVGIAAGLASCGKIPFAYTIANFLTMRAFEQIRNDVCLQKMNVKLIGIGAGFAYSTAGPTHHSVTDIALMRALPGMTVLAPADDLEVGKATEAAARIDGPVYLRLARGGSLVMYHRGYDFEVGKGIRLSEGHDLTIIASGASVYDAIKVRDILKRSFHSTVRVVNIHTIKPIDRDIIIHAAMETGRILTIEEHSIIGGLGSAVAEVLAEESLPQRVAFKRLGLNDMFPKGYGTYEEMKKLNGLSITHIVREAEELLKCNRY